MSDFFARLAEYILSWQFFTGALITLALTLISETIGILFGFLLALMNTSRIRVFKAAADGYIWFFRGTPVLLQMIFVFNALPQLGLRFSSFLSAAISLSMNESAYMSEIIRAGLESVGKGQREAARAVGLTEWKVMRFIIIPQALRVIIPPTANQFIGMLKLSALASVIAVRDLLLTAQRWASVNFDYVTTLAAAAVYYLVLTTFFTIIQKRIEFSYSEKFRTAALKKNRGASQDGAGDRNR